MKIQFNHSVPYGTFNKIVPRHLYTSLISDVQTPRQTHTSLHTMVAPDTPYHSTKFQPDSPSKSKVIQLM